MLFPSQATVRVSPASLIRPSFRTGRNRHSVLRMAAWQNGKRQSHSARDGFFGAGDFDLDETKKKAQRL